MADMFTALRNAGLLSEKDIALAEAQKQIDAEARLTERKKGQGDRERRLEILRTTNSVSTFRFEAHKLLVEYPALIGEVTQLAHDRKLNERKKDGGGRLISNLLELRRSLNSSGLDDDQKADLIKQVLPKK